METNKTNKPTQGPWIVCEEPDGSDTIRHDETGDMVCEFPYGLDGVHAADAALIAEAGTSFHETGLTPRQLADRVSVMNEAIAILSRKCAELAQNECDCKEYIDGVGTKKLRASYSQLAQQRAELLAALESICGVGLVAQMRLECSNARTDILAGQQLSLSLDHARTAIANATKENAP